MKDRHIQKEKIFIIAGMPRTGTTFLYHNLQKHPNIFVPYRKELEFFNFYYDKGYDWYTGHFKKMKPDQVGFDIGPKYFLENAVIERIKEFNPDIKVILGVRDPVEFALSWYNQYNTFTLNMPSYEDFLDNFYLPRLDKEIHVQLTKNLIPRMLENYQKAFGDNLLLFSYNIFRKDPLIVLRAIESFVGVPPYFNEHNFDNVVINAAIRKNIKLVSYILSRERVITTLRVLFPGRLIRFLRSKFDRIGKRKTGTSMKSYSPEDIKFTEEALGDQRAYIKEIFAESEILIGSGKPFNLDCS